MQAAVQELEKFRCNLCRQLFRAQAPERINGKTHDTKSASIMVLLRYGRAMSLHRLEKLQEGRWAFRILQGSSL